MKKKITVLHQYNYQFLPKHGETNNDASITVQGEAYSIAELYRRSTGGINDTLQREGFYPEDVTFDDIDLEKISRLDLTEIEENKLDLLRLELNEALEKKKEANDSEEDSNKKTDEDQKDELPEE